MHLPPLDHLPSLKRICLSGLRNLEFIGLSDGVTHSHFFYILRKADVGESG